MDIRGPTWYGGGMGIFMMDIGGPTWYGGGMGWIYADWDGYTRIGMDMRGMVCLCTGYYQLRSIAISGCLSFSGMNSIIIFFKSCTQYILVFPRYRLEIIYIVTNGLKFPAP